MQLYTMTETCSILGVTRKTIYNWIERGVLKPVEIVGGWRRIPKSEIDRLTKIKSE